MKRRFRSYDYREEYVRVGKLVAIHIRIHDTLLHTMYYAEWVVGSTFKYGNCFYDDAHEPIDDGRVSPELYAYTERAFLWRVNLEIRKYDALMLLRGNDQAPGTHPEDGTEHGTVSLAQQRYW